MITISESEFGNMSNDALSRLTKGQGITFYLKDGKMTQACVKDYLVTDSHNGIFMTKLGCSILREEIKSIEIFEDGDCPKLVL